MGCVLFIKTRIGLACVQSIIAGMGGLLSHKKKEMNYPKMPEKLDRRKKLTVRKLKNIKKLFEQGFSKRYLAKKYRVSVSLLCYHLNGQEYKKRWIEKCKIRIKESMKSPGCRDRKREINNKSHRYKKVVVPEENRYNVLNCKRWRHRGERERKRWREYNRVWRGKQKKLTPLVPINNKLK